MSAHPTRFLLLLVALLGVFAAGEAAGSARSPATTRQVRVLISGRVPAPAAQAPLRTIPCAATTWRPAADHVTLSQRVIIRHRSRGPPGV